MPRYLLDPNIVSFALRKAHPPLDRRLAQVPNHQLALSTIVEAELRYGAARLPSSARLHTLLADFLPRIQILPWDSPCAAAFATLRRAQELSGESLALADTMIAAHALALGLTLVTNDQAFRHIPALHVEDWTQAPLHP